MAKTTIIRFEEKDKPVWRMFKRICLDREISANRLVKELIRDFVIKNR